jgi:hypothetical protein
VQDQRHKASAPQLPSLKTGSLVYSGTSTKICHANPKISPEQEPTNKESSLAILFYENDILILDGCEVQIVGRHQKHSTKSKTVVC